MPDLNYNALPATDEAPQLVCERKHAHYHKSVAHLGSVDVYRVLDLFGVTDQALGHAIKKLLVAGNRGVKNIDRDVQEAIDTLQRWQEMQAEDAGVQK
jgi:hypothetical protein